MHNRVWVFLIWALACAWGLGGNAEAGNNAPIITSTLSATGTLGVAFSYQITALNSPTSFSATLPQGFSLNPTTGLISGTPTATGTFIAPIAAINKSGTGQASLTITVPVPPVIVNTIYVSALCSFSSDYPRGGLVQARDGNFYGVTSGGGVGDYGKVFRVTPSGALSGSLSTLFSFSGTNGNFPSASLTQGNDGDLYGTTYQGGSGNNGTIFRITSSGSLTTLAAFNGSNGGGPSGLIQGSDGNFYGTTYSGGSYGYGTVFRVSSSGSLQTLHSFNYDAGGANPFARLTQGSDGNFYGTTYSGGTFNRGTVFRMTPSGSLTALCSFSGTAGATPGSCPKGDLAQGSDGNFYGTTYSGGTSDLGTVYRITSSGSLTNLCSFTGTTGSTLGTHPAGLIQASNGNFYGITETGGTNNYGTAFQVTSNGALSTLTSFAWSFGADPTGALIQGRDGALYGLTTSGGASLGGNVFRIGQDLMTADPLGAVVEVPVISSIFPATFSASGLPPGLAIDPGTGIISGTLTGSGTFSATVSASSPGGTGSATLSFAVLPPPPVVASSLSAGAISGSVFSYQIAATNGPSSFYVTGLPIGLVLSPFTGQISGTPTQTGTFNVGLIANNLMGSGSNTLSLVVRTPWDAWKSTIFTPAELSDESVSGDQACPAGDGIPNLMKYALNLDPRSCGTGGLPKAAPLVTGSGNYLSLTYTRVLSATDLLYTIEVSDDLQTWYSGPGYTSPVQVTNDPGGQTQSVVEQDLVPMNAASHRFIRLKVTKCPTP